MTDEEFIPWVGNRDGSPKGGDRAANKGKGKADGKGKANGKAAKPGQFCYDFAKTGFCPREEKYGEGKCIFAHKTQAHVDADKVHAAPALAVPG